MVIRAFVEYAEGYDPNSNHERGTGAIFKLECFNGRKQWRYEGSNFTTWVKVKNLVPFKFSYPHSGLTEFPFEESQLENQSDC